MIIKEKMKKKKIYLENNWDGKDFKLPNSLNPDYIKTVYKKHILI